MRTCVRLCRHFSSRRGRRSTRVDVQDELEIEPFTSKYGKKTLNHVNALLAAQRNKEHGIREPSANEVLRWKKIVAKKQERTQSHDYLSQPIFRPDSPTNERFGTKSMLDYEERVPNSIFPGPIHVVSSAEEELVHRPAIESMRIIGVDCETKPTMFRDHAVGPIALVQLASNDISILYRIRWNGAWNPALEFPGLRHIMASTDTIKVGHGCDFDFKSMQSCGLVSNIFNTIDTLPVASKIGCLKPNLRALGMIWHGVCISKAMQTSNWEETTLSQEQVEYAATDAWLSRQVMMSLMQFEPSRKFLRGKHYATDKSKALDDAAILEKLLIVANEEGFLAM